MYPMSEAFLQAVQENTRRYYCNIMDTVKNSEVMQKQWKNYQKDFEYATDITFEDACDVVVELKDDLEGEEKLSRHDILRKLKKPVKSRVLGDREGVDTPLVHQRAQCDKLDE